MKGTNATVSHTHLTLYFRRMDALLNWYSIPRHEVACGFDLIPLFGVQLLQEMEVVIIGLCIAYQAGYARE